MSPQRCTLAAVRVWERRRPSALVWWMNAPRAAAHDVSEKPARMCNVQVDRAGERAGFPYVVAPAAVQWGVDVADLRVLADSVASPRASSGDVTSSHTNPTHAGRFCFSAPWMSQTPLLGLWCFVVNRCDA
eukprot:NODE_11690_length_1270_cov_16.496938.p2 GENE.NODE_11690_length_1270_cov_16.496938~~NODE_11690_length_1270_cov_16.496938.p2  ORF type:complete len:131 (+),score=6.67 NODE_11690_length_1270_cov_16.496938:298-690(+)